MPTPYGVVQEKLQKITETGSNRYPNVAPDNQQLLYVSSLRDKHAHSQIYMLNLGSKKEKRLTYQDGNIINPQFFLNTQQVIYESTTDEDKEWPYLVGKYSTSLKSPPLATKTIELFNDLLPLNNFEIYLSDNAGYSIRRLTDSRYFDGTTFILNAKELIFSSFQRQQIDLYKLKYQKRKWRRFRLTHTPEHELQAQVHKASAKMAWVRMDKEFLYSHIFIGDLNAKKGEVIDTGVHYSFHPQWHPSGQYLIFTSNLANYDNYEIYAFDLKTQCLLRLTYLTSNELDPTF
ncbi:MAG: PD40 domain-containing protein, partial [Bdellovibrionales bacterium]|nr:PD40 domain-containing protein [Bdellovibrionales bacterium]